MSFRMNLVEKRLIDDFKKDFHKKVGYYPEVISKLSKFDAPINFMSLEELTKYFEPFLPKIGNKIVPLAKKSRYREIVELRFIFCYLAKKIGYTTTATGRFLNRDHSTVVYAIEQFKSLIQQGEGFQLRYKAIVDYITTGELILNQELEEKETV
jgi:hypothetical protein